MANNVTLNSGSGGAVAATDDVSSVHYQVVKLADGTEDATTRIAAGGGVQANALRVTVASDSTGVLSVDDNGGSLTVDNAGTFAVQEDGAALTALQLIDDPVFADNAAFTLGTSKVSMAGAIRDDALSALSAVEADAVPLRVDANGGLWVTQSGTVTVDGSGVTQPVSGTITANLGAVDNAVLDSIDAAVNGTLTVGSHAVTNAGTFAVQVDGAALTALQLLDDIVATDDTSTHATGTTKGAVMMAAAAPTDGSVDANDIGAVAMSTDRRLLVDAQIVGTDAALDVSGATVTVDNGGTFAVQAAQSGTWNVTNISGTVSLPTGASTAAKQPALGTAGSASADVITVQGIASMTALVVDGSGVTQPVSGTVTANLGATDNAVLDQIETNTSGSTSHYRNVDANAEAEIKGSAGTLNWLHAMNMTSAVAYVHLYDATAAAVTPGTTTPTYTFPLATQGDTNGAGFVLPAPIEFANAITIVVTTTIDGSAGDPGTNGVFVNAGYT